MPRKRRRTRAEHLAQPLAMRRVRKRRGRRRRRRKQKRRRRQKRKREGAIWKSRRERWK